MLNSMLATPYFQLSFVLMALSDELWNSAERQATDMSTNVYETRLSVSVVFAHSKFRRFETVSWKFKLEFLLMLIMNIWTRKLYL
jgi:hypothetical protein